MQVVHTKSIAEFVSEVQTSIDEQNKKLRTLAQAVLEAHNGISGVLAKITSECKCPACTIAREVLK